ncbi:EAL domain-containing protein [Bradyrhizobium sp. AS23.2]|uniref:EAL domain-containing protein n=1 Tax=Bradyrhizobium sp. AS23.2 TaxID=1680155 RepID=UPI001FD87FD5|nr:EAL domain-containing protein [Bradyrhizobium sp. AS23.2]
MDRTFVDGISTAPEKHELLGGIVALWHGLGMTVGAEGAELPAEADVLGRLDCDLVQGFVLSPQCARDRCEHAHGRRRHENGELIY